MLPVVGPDRYFAAGVAFVHCSQWLHERRLWFARTADDNGVFWIVKLNANVGQTLRFVSDEYANCAKHAETAWALRIRSSATVCGVVVEPHDNVACFYIGINVRRQVVIALLLLQLLNEFLIWCPSDRGDIDIPSRLIR